MSPTVRFAMRRGPRRLRPSQLALAGALIVALAVAAVLMFTIGPFSSAMPWGGHHVDIRIDDVAQVTLQHGGVGGSVRPNDITLNNAGQPKDVATLLSALETASEAQGERLMTPLGGYPNSVMIKRNDGSQLTMTPACVVESATTCAYDAGYFHVYDSRIGGRGSMYHSSELAAWFKDVFTQYYP